MGNFKNKWEKQRYLEVREIAKKCKRRSEFQLEHKTDYHWAWSHGYLEEFCAHMPEKHKEQIWTKEKIKEEAKKYKRRGEFQIKSRVAYMAAYTQGILDEVCKHMSAYKTWINKNVREDKITELALSYEKISLFQKKNMGAYYAAKRYGVYDKIKTTHKEFYGDTTQR